MQDKVAQALKRVRRAQGALQLTTLEAQAIYDGAVLQDLKPDENNRAKELIAYFMIAANGVVAQYLEAQQRASLRRVLRQPERWPRLVELARGFGDTLPADPDAKALSAFLVRRQQAAPEQFCDLSLTVVKLLGAGVRASRARGTSGSRSMTTPTPPRPTAASRTSSRNAW
jgi:exoribonuclease-2